MEHIQKLLEKSDDLLDAEMTRSQSLIEDMKNVHVKYKELETRHEHSQPLMKISPMIIFKGSKSLRN